MARKETGVVYQHEIAEGADAIAEELEDEAGEFGLSNASIVLEGLDERLESDWEGRERICVVRLVLYRGGIGKLVFCADGEG